jgi:hypothetical protein
MESTWTKNLEANGFAIIDRVVSTKTVQALIEVLIDLPSDAASRTRNGQPFARRNLLEMPEIATLANSLEMRGLIDQVLGADAIPVRGILFDKNPDANWVVPWHRDLSIAVDRRIDLPGFGPWSTKAGVVHVQPPIEILAKMLTVRLHLDYCPESNGALRVVPGSHRQVAREIDHSPADQTIVACPVNRGGVLLMRPLLLHASAPANQASHRRVIHIEYAGCALPGGLRWHAEIYQEFEQCPPPKKN